MINYSIIFCMTVGLALLLTPAMIGIARLFNVYDRVGVRKVHTRQIPRIGGVAIVLSMVAAMGVAIYWFPALKPMLAREKSLILCVGGAALMIFLLGLIDDIFHLDAWVKLLVQVTAAYMVCLGGVRMETLALSETWALHLGWFSWPFTIVWILGITNALNLIDGLDGLAGGIALIAAAALTLFCLCTQQIVIMMVMLGMMGSLTGFLFFNAHPARIFMGDSGSLFLGFTLAVATVVCVWRTQWFSALAVAILALGVPICDTLIAMMRRTLERRSLFSPDRSHFHHRLLDLGLDQKRAVAFACVLSIGLGGLGLLTIPARDFSVILLTVCLLALYVQVFHLTGAIQLRAIRHRIRTNRTLSAAARQSRGEFEQARLLVSRARTFAQWWQALGQAADTMGVAWLTLTIHENGCVTQSFDWRGPYGTLPQARLIQTNLPVPSHFTGLQLRLDMALILDDSLESAGNRIALFSRLVDEFGLKELNWPRERDLLFADEPETATEAFHPVQPVANPV